jgi:hypothetical protein
MECNECSESTRSADKSPSSHTMRSRNLNLGGHDKEVGSNSWQALMPDQNGGRKIIVGQQNLMLNTVISLIMLANKRTVIIKPHYLNSLITD